MIGIVSLMLFVATVPLANWMIGNVGACLPDGPCVIPVGFGLTAPSGVLVIGAALVLRDIVHERLGARAALAAITLGSVIAFAVSSPAVVWASVAAFVLSELADFAVYAPLRRRKLWLAVTASGGVGAAVDSAAFMLIAFGTLDYVAGQIVGKIWMTAIGASALAIVLKFRKPIDQEPLRM